MLFDEVEYDLLTVSLKNKQSLIIYRGYGKIRNTTIYDGYSFEENKPFSAGIRKEGNEFQVATILVCAPVKSCLLSFFLCTH